MRIYIERHGRPFNFLSSIKDLNIERENYLKEQESQANNRIEEQDKGYVEFFNVF
jgi:thioester reductase-like protein